LARGALALPWKIYKVDSVTTFCFAQKVPKSLPQDTFMAQNIRTLLPQTQSCIKAIRFTAEETGHSGEREQEGEGEAGEKWRDRGRNGLCPLLQEFLPAPTIAVKKLYCTSADW